MSQANPDKRNRSLFIILRVLFGLQGLLLLPTALEKIPTEDAFLGWIMLAYAGFECGNASSRPILAPQKSPRKVLVLFAFGNGVVTVTSPRMAFGQAFQAQPTPF